MGIFNLFKGGKGKEVFENFFQVDIHSHLLYGLDDGASDVETSISLIRALSGLGFKKLITTPHIMGDFYKNDPDKILNRLSELRERILHEGIDISLEAAAEYFLDEFLIKKLEKDEPLLTFGETYLLFETGFMVEPAGLKEAIFLMTSSGYKPVLAHPERYIFLYQDFSKYKDLKDRGVLFQLNLNSLSGYYSPASKKIAEKLIDHKMIDFVGTDCHGERHLEAFQRTLHERYFEKLKALHILNNTLL